MSKLKQTLSCGDFAVTCELSPPKGADVSAMLAKAEMLRERVTAFNLTDSAAARMTMDPSAAGFELLKRDLEPIVQVTSRDKNRLALQSGMLGANLLGIKNLVIMGGDPPHIGDHPEAKGVNDLFSSQIIDAAHALNNGRDHAGNDINAPTDFFIGSVCNPGAKDLDAEIENTQRKAEAGARFFQTQAIYRAEQFTAFAERLNIPDVVLLAGVIPIKSVKMATYMNEKVPGIDIPDDLIKRIADAESDDCVVPVSLEIAAHTIKQLRGACHGIHVMAIGWEKHIGALLEVADI